MDLEEVSEITPAGHAEGEFSVERRMSAESLTPQYTICGSVLGAGLAHVLENRGVLGVAACLLFVEDLNLDLDWSDSVRATALGYVACFLGKRILKKASAIGAVKDVGENRRTLLGMQVSGDPRAPWWAYEVKPFLWVLVAMGLYERYCRHLLDPVEMLPQVIECASSSWKSELLWWCADVARPARDFLLPFVCQEILFNWRPDVSAAMPGTRLAPVRTSLLEGIKLVEGGKITLFSLCGWTGMQVSLINLIAHGCGFVYAKLSSAAMRRASNDRLGMVSNLLTKFYHERTIPALAHAATGHLQEDPELEGEMDKPEPTPLLRGLWFGFHPLSTLMIFMGWTVNPAGLMANGLTEGEFYGIMPPHADKMLALLGGGENSGTIGGIAGLGCCWIYGAKMNPRDNRPHNPVEQQIHFAQKGKGVRRRVEPSSGSSWKNGKFLRIKRQQAELFSFLASNVADIDTNKHLPHHTRHGVLCFPNRQDVSALAPCTHEEADTRILLHLQDAVQQGYSKVSKLQSIQTWESWP
ncbi:hypothetical protein GWK47_024930 [Chionoecetes opilio]|uniref:Uncharacterized protein n=1 Tax=Chionoecetes opilio TaxID=41210 RepID=A0A8J4XPH4_CHIOP|nr:hypothetical protein GWK47_024930 [Chionoecetes opilio]